MDKNEDTYNKYVHMYYEQYLDAGERTIIKRFKDRWSQMDILDIGVGAGRTSYAFSAISRNYIGIDYVPRSIEICKNLVGEDETVKFFQCDARYLSKHFSKQFDFIMFALCGIDSVDHEGRYMIFREIRKCLKDDGYFFFSSHSLNAPQRTLVLPRFNPLRPFRSTYRVSKTVFEYWRIKWANRNMFDNRERGWTIAKDDLDYHFLDIYYISPEYQIQQLDETGFKVVEVYGRNGKPIDYRIPRDDLWIHYLCQLKKDD